MKLREGIEEELEGNLFEMSMSIYKIYLEIKSKTARSQGKGVNQEHNLNPIF